MWNATNTMQAHPQPHVRPTPTGGVLLSLKLLLCTRHHTPSASNTTTASSLHTQLQHTQPS